MFKKMIHDVDEEYSHIRLKKWKKSAEPKTNV